ncbi:MAG: hypothetical protein AAF362_00020 [Pseudomonadota bacterium]
MVDRQQPTDNEHDESVEGGIDRDRRKLITSVGKFSAYVAPATIVLLDAETAYAHRVCSWHPHPTRWQRWRYWRWWRRNCRRR